MTPGEIHLVIDAFRKSQDDALDLAVVTAWHTARLSKAARIPLLSRLLERRNSKRLSADDVHVQIEKLRAIQQREGARHG